jgi:hypothetical protein
VHPVATRIKRIHIARCFLVLCAAGTAQLSAQASDCNIPGASPEATTREQQWWDTQSSPVYADATNLARDLASHGIVVECILSSKEESRVKNQKGAAWFKTDKGIFDAWFMPDPEAAAAVEATKRQTSSTNEFFVQFQSIVFHITQGQSTLAATLQKAFPAP